MEAIYKERDTLKLDAESLRLVEFYHREFVHAGANLSDADKTELKKMNEEISTLENDFKTKLLAATQEAAFAHRRQDQAGGVERSAISRGCASCEAEKAGRLGADPAEHHPAALPCRPERPRDAPGTV